MYYHYRVDPELGKAVCAICQVSCAFTACVAQLDKYWLPTIAASSQPRYARVEKCYYNKIIEHYHYWIIMKFLDNKKPQDDFDNIHAFILVVMSTNKSELFEVNGYGYISSSDGAEYNSYIVHFTYLPYTLQ